jgi:S1-C subfamily serine protease
VNGPVASNSDLQALQGTFEQIYEQVNPSVVNISVTAAATQTPFGTESSSSGLGSGFVWDSEGHIVTNNHVIEGADGISVTFADGTTVDAKLVGADPEADLAVIKVDPAGVQLSPVAMADSSQIKVGQIAIAIGNPYGLSGTMTQGIVSALDRSLSASSDSALTTGTYTIPDIIQTDAAINPGNSGGVLVNTQGQVMGVTAAIRSSSDSNSGIGFVIPANIVNQVVPVLINDGSYEHPRLGVSGTTMTAEIAEAMNLDRNQKGVLIIQVSDNSPAEKAGLQGSPNIDSNDPTAGLGGDVIIKIDNQEVRAFDDLTSYLFNNTKVGQTVTLTIIRDGREQTVDLTLGVVPLQPGQ